MAILEGNYHDSIRRKLGVGEDVISNDDIDDPTVKGVAEAQIKKYVPDYESIVDETDLLFLRSAATAYVAYILCPTVPARHKTSVKTIDTSWKKEKIDWEKRSESLLNEALLMLESISTVAVVIDYTCDIFKIAKSGRVRIDGN